MAEKVALSPSAIQRRLRRMRELGVIERDIAVVDLRKLDFSTSFIVSVQVEREAGAAITVSHLVIDSRTSAASLLRNW